MTDDHLVDDCDPSFSPDVIAERAAEAALDVMADALMGSDRATDVFGVYFNRDSYAEGDLVALGRELSAPGSPARRRFLAAAKPRLTRLLP